jgi:hypothetical protein
MSNGREELLESARKKSTDKNGERDFINEEIKEGITPL